LNFILNRNIFLPKYVYLYNSAFIQWQKYKYHKYITCDTCTFSEGLKHANDWVEELNRGEKSFYHSLKLT